MFDAVGVGIMLDVVVTSLAHVGLKLNASKTKVLTTQAQTPSTLKTPAGVQAKKIDRRTTHACLGCLSSMETAAQRQYNINIHQLSFTTRIMGVSSSKADTV